MSLEERFKVRLSVLILDSPDALGVVRQTDGILLEKQFVREMLYAKI